MLIAVTFALAFAAYLLLCGQALLHLRGAGSRALAMLLALTATAHVALVWHESFAWSAAEAWTRSPAAFVVFHSALSLIVAAAAVPSRWAGRCLGLAWPLVTLGALGAVVRREVVASYFWPVVVAAAVTMALGVWQIRNRQ